MQGQQLQKLWSTYSPTSEIQSTIRVIKALTEPSAPTLVAKLTPTTATKVHTCKSFLVNN